MRVSFSLCLFLMTLLFSVHSMATKPAPRKAKVKAKAATTTLSQAQRKALFEKGNKLYVDGKFNEAIAAFEKLTKAKGWENFAVWYNLGNSYYRLQQYGIALGYYRRAQRLRPNHQPLLHNVQLLLRRVGKTGGQTSMRAKVLFWYYLFNLKQLFLGFALLLALSLLVWGLTIRQGAEGKGQALRWVTVGLFAATAILGLSFGLKWSAERSQSSGVVIESKVSARSGYGSQYESLFLLTEADEVRILESVGKWLRVELTLNDAKKGSSRQQGWVPSKAIFKIR